MEVKRQAFQGVLNIIRFNWHFYFLAGTLFVLAIVLKNLFSPVTQNLIVTAAGISFFLILLSLVISFYVYDLSGLYKFTWLRNADGKRILNINAGFDETTELIRNRFPGAKLTVCDFYNSAKHTEISIKRARSAYPPHSQSIAVATERLPFVENTFDMTLAILSAHEIRDEFERIEFFKELARITKSSGEILVTEHLRDINNFLAYSIGVTHFHSRQTWLQTFKYADLTVENEIKTTPFITTFILKKNGNTL